MTTSETYIPHPVVVYFFVAPSQKLVRWNYASIRDAKKVWHATRLQATASVPLQPCCVPDADWLGHIGSSPPWYENVEASCTKGKALSPNRVVESQNPAIT